MSDKKRNIAVIMNAVIWAAVILTVSWITKGAVDKDTGFTITMILVAGWFATNGLITPQTSVRDEIQCLKKMFKKKA